MDRMGTPTQCDMLCDTFVVSLVAYSARHSLLLTPLCCDDAYPGMPRDSALAGCDRLVSEPLVIKNFISTHGLLDIKRSRREPIKEEPLKEPNEEERKRREREFTFPVRQKKRVLAKDRNEAVTAEVDKLVEARILKEVYFLQWVANPTVYPIREDQKIESLDGFRYKFFLDAYKGYHQIRMAEEDEEKTTFYTEQGTFCYEKMPFGLKNAGATYQRLATENFSGHLITKQGIEPNPEKVKAIIDMLSPRTIREVQSLNGKLTALDRFLARSTEKALPFFKTLKGCIEKRDFWGSQEVEEALQKLKLHLQSLPALIVPIPGETLTLYLAASHETVSSVLMAEWEGLELSTRLEVHHLQAFTDSLLVTNHVKGTYEAREESMKRYIAKVQSLQERFKSFSITQIPHSKNKRANALSKLASSSFVHLTKKVLVEIIPCRSIDMKTVNTVEEPETTWMDPIINYLRDGRLLEDPVATRKIRVKAPQYLLKKAFYIGKAT
ncbi:reverse transcriptase domain-containing protein [Tanacetum coccineum]|uniref:Reverse transcriptase domain-containing protein n=1 Tax=Tanacetum coccineum TaxID=301880 RepID=A0ABQ5B754_9ASTR